MIKIQISNDFKTICPSFKGASLSAQVQNTLHNEELWKLIEAETAYYKTKYVLDDIKKNSIIAATRNAYKQFGKDPNRYRPSAEALCRRIVRNLPLYKISTLVDIINLVSIQTGYSIGGFDADKIQGNIILGIGKKDEPYMGIGKGILNIEGLPVYRDNQGGIGTPTSDNERTKINLETTYLLVIFNGYNGGDGLQEALIFMQKLITDFASAKNVQISHF